jgi:hypothetical protein
MSEKWPLADARGSVRVLGRELLLVFLIVVGIVGQTDQGLSERAACAGQPVVSRV